MSVFSLLGVSHSKHWISEAKVSPTMYMAKPSPGQPLLPDPKGMNLNPSLNPSHSSNLSGLNLVGSSHILGSCWMAHKFTNNIVPRGTRKPPTWHSWDDSWGSSGPAGYSRKASFMMQLRYGSLDKSDSSTRRSCPTQHSNSSCAFFKTLRWLSNKDIAHSMVTEEVSDPEENKVCACVYIYIRWKLMVENY